MGATMTVVGSSDHQVEGGEEERERIRVDRRLADGACCAEREQDKDRE